MKESFRQARAALAAWAFFMLFAGWAFPLAAQQTPAQPQAPAAPTAGSGTANGALNGIVRTANGVAIPGATLQLTETSSGKAWVTWTDESGRFSLPGLPPGHYRTEATQLGFERAEKEFDLAANGTPPVDLSLKISTLEAIEQAPNAPSTALAAAAGAAGTTAAGAPPSGGGSQTQASGTNPASTGGAGRGGYGGAGGRGGFGGGQRGQGAAGGPAGGAPGQGRGGFQQLALANRPAEGDATAAEPGEEAAGPAAEAAPLGQASTSDAFLMNGTVGRGVEDTGFQGGPPGGFGGGSDFGAPGGGATGLPGIGGPGGPGGGGAPGMNLRIGAGPAGGGGRGRGGPGGGPRGAPGGVAALFGMQRVLRQRANQVHFSMYDQYSNAVLDARPYALTGATTPKIPAWNERFGGNLGGPLKIPHVYNGSDRTFIFVNLDTTWARNAVDQFSSVPTPAERGGDFSDRNVQLLCPTVNPYPLSTPLGAALGADCPVAGGPLNPGNPSVIPQNIMSNLPAASTGLLSFLPSPNLSGLVDNYHLQTVVPTQQDRLNVRLMQTISPKLNARVIYAFNQGASHAFQSFPSFESNQDTRGQSVTLGLTQNFSRTLINDTQLIYSRNRSQTLNGFAFQNDVAGNLGITGVSTAPIDWGVPQLNFTNYTGANNAIPSLVRNQTFRFVDALTKIFPKHTLTAGGELRRIENNTTSDPIPEGRFTFNGLMTGNDFADFLLGLPGATDERFGTAATYFRSWGYAAYATDDWRVKPDFTLEYGVRYEYFTPFTELYGHIADLDVNPSFTQAAVAVPGQAAPFGESLPASLIRPQYNHWAPRLGFAWRPPLKALQAKHAMTVRAGYGMFYNESIYSQLAGELANQPPWATSSLLQTSAAAPLTLQNGFPAGATPLNTATNTYAVNPNYHTGYAQIWNLSIETALRTNTTFVVTYTGTKGTNLDMLLAPNRLPPGSTATSGPVAGAGSFIYDTSGANSLYNAVQVRLQQRMTRGLGFGVNYTYGRSVDDASSIGGGQGVVVQNPLDLAAEYGRSSFDVRHKLGANYTYELPFGDRHRFAQKGVSAALIGNWRLSGNITAQSGTPYTAEILSTTAGNTGAGGTFAMRADQICNPNLPPSQRGPLQFFNAACFVAPAAGTYGDAARNTIEGPGSFVWNAQIAKTFSFGKDQNRRLDVRWEVTNLTNTPNFTGLSTVVNSSTFGRVLSVSGMRTMDILTRVNF